MLTLERFEEACRNRKAGDSGDKAGQQQLFLRTDRKQGLSETGEYAENRRIQGTWCLLQDQHPYRGRKSKGPDHSFRRKPCTGCGLCGTEIMA